MLYLQNDWSEDLAKEMMDIIAQGVVTAEVSEFRV